MNSLSGFPDSSVVINFEFKTNCGNSVSLINTLFEYVILLSPTNDGWLFSNHIIERWYHVLFDFNKFEIATSPVALPLATNDWYSYGVTDDLIHS